jgi:hypothetical protein
MLRTSVQNPNIKFTSIGGLAILITNKTGANSVKGKVLRLSKSFDYAVDIIPISGVDPIGVFLDDGVPDGNKAWIVIHGMADVAMKNNTATTHGNWLKVSDEAGYADATLTAPPGGGIPEIDEHFLEMGHCMQSVAAGGEGTHILARCVLHYN